MGLGDGQLGLEPCRGYAYVAQLGQSTGTFLHSRERRHSKASRGPFDRAHRLEPTHFEGGLVAWPVARRPLRGGELAQRRPPQRNAGERC